MAAVDRNGTLARRTIPLRVWTPIETAYESSGEAVQAFAPERVAGCTPGNAPPPTLTYTESSTETRKRSLNTALITKPMAQAEVLVLTAKLEGELGIKVDDEVSSAQMASQGLSVQVLPGEYATIYRQTIQLERRVNVREHGACGESVDLGYAIVTDWTWSPEFAKAKQPECPPWPLSKLKAQRFD